MQGPLNPSGDFKLSLMGAFLGASACAAFIFRKCVDSDYKPLSKQFGTAMFSRDEVRYREMLISFVLQMRTAINHPEAFCSLKGNRVQNFSLPALTKDTQLYQVLKTDAIRLVHRINHDSAFCRELMYDFAQAAQDLQKINSSHIYVAANEGSRPTDPVMHDTVHAVSIS
ncbi:MAG: hypothetical protein RBR86_06545 [Pseudobdellovibrionaceae bacterium]|jgi:hypothetical protein|nr:hypothetical protein [Pseudobdellovibrionaceae bacterium]